MKQQNERPFEERETQETSSFLNADTGDSFARLNALLRTCKNVQCYTVLQKKTLIQITEIRPFSDETQWYCVVYDEEQKGTALLIPKGSPLLLYIR